MRADRAVSTFVALLLAGCSGPAMVMLQVNGPPLDLGDPPASGDEGQLAILVRGDSLDIVSLDKERVVLHSYALSDGAAASEDLMGLQPELFELTEDLLTRAVLAPDVEDLGDADQEECLRTGLSDMGRTAELYQGGVIALGENLGFILSARTTLKCPDLGVSTVVSVEHLVVLDATGNRVQDDAVAWIGEPPMSATALALEGGRLGAAWITPRGVWVVGTGGAPEVAIGFVAPWTAGSVPVHFLVEGGDDLSFAFGVIDRPMASVGQGESYLLLYMATLDDPTYQEVVRLELPDHPQAAAAVWTGEQLDVVMFAETLKPHAESFARVHVASFGASGTQVGELVDVHAWKDHMGGSFGLLDLGIGHVDGVTGAAWLFRRATATNVELAWSSQQAGGQAATYELGWEVVDLWQVLAGPDGLVLLWADPGMHLVSVPVP